MEPQSPSLMLADSSTDSETPTKPSVADPADSRCRRITRVCLAMSTIISFLALFGWSLSILFDWRPGPLILASFHPNPDVVPMAPVTAVAFLLITFAVILYAWRFPNPTRRMHWGIAVIALPVFVFGIYKLSLFAQGHVGEGVEQTVAKAVGEQGRVQKNADDVPKGVMSPVTAASFLLAAMAVVLLVIDRNPWLARTATLCAMVVIFVNLWTLLRYLEPPEKIFAFFKIPVAIPTALGFLLVGVALVTVQGSEHGLIRPLIGRSTRAMLLRAFLPMTLLVLLFALVLSRMLQRLQGTEGANAPFVRDVLSGVSAFWVMISIVITTVVISWISQRIGQRLEGAEAETERAMRELRKARDAAKASDRAKSEFLANMSHELRTPLNSVIGYSEMLREEAEEHGHNDYLPDLRQIHASGQHLLTLINDILDLSKIDAGEMRLRPENVDLDEFLENVLTSIRPNIEKNKNELRLICQEKLGTITTDPIRLHQCLLNLLSNAGKFTEQGTVTLRASRITTKAGDDRIVFDVIDTGIGMDVDQLELIFEPFKQSDASTTRRYEGTGLGLTICRKLMVMLGGNVRVESKLGKGSTFTLDLPAEFLKSSGPSLNVFSPKAVTEKIKAGASPTGQNVVMVVDDDPVVRNLLTRFLQNEGFQVVVASCGEEVLPLAKSVRPQAITLDVMMPEMDGWQVISLLKEDPKTADIPVIILTIVEDKNMGYMLGASDYLTKPFDRQQLLMTLSRYCNVSQQGLAMVVEDDAPTRELIRRSLEKDNWEVVEASNGGEAWACMSRRAPSLILLDLMMPDIDGFEFLDELRRHPQWRTIPVIVITAKDLSDEDRMYLNGSLFLSGSVKQVLQKGHFDREQLLKEVQELVKVSTP